MTPVVEFARRKHQYTVNGERVPSVTQVLGVLDKPALPWWGMKTGVKGILRLIEGGQTFDTVESAVSALTANKLTVNHVRDARGDVGSALHRALESYISEKIVPSPRDFADEDRGFVRALAHWLSDTRPEFLATEVIVGSANYRFAGTYDFRANVDGRTVIGDLKSSKRVYDTHHLQVAAYEGAAVECGADPTDAQIIVRVGADGTYEVVESQATYEQFLSVRDAYSALQGVKGAIKEQKKAA